MLKEVIRDKTGAIIRQSRNLAGIRAHVAAGLRIGRYNFVDVISIDELPNTNGRLTVLFENGDNYETNFASFDVLRDWLRNWRNVHGVHIRINGNDCGVISASNKHLKR